MAVMRTVAPLTVAAAIAEQFEVMPTARESARDSAVDPSPYAGTKEQVCWPSSSTTPLPKSLPELPLYSKSSSRYARMEFWRTTAVGHKVIIGRRIAGTGRIPVQHHSWCEIGRFRFVVSHPSAIKLRKDKPPSFMLGQGWGTRQQLQKANPQLLDNLHMSIKVRYTLPLDEVPVDLVSREVLEKVL